MTHNTDAELLPCPFCGTDAKAVNSYEDDDWRVECWNDECSVHGKRCQNRSDAALEWNRRAPAAPVPQRRLTLDEVEQAVGYHSSAWDCVDPSDLVDAIFNLAAAPQPPEAAPDCLTCNDHGAVGNILNAEPCPDCTPPNSLAAPVQMPEPVAHLWQHGETGRTRVVMPDAITDCDAQWQLVGGLHTEQQVRQLLADQQFKLDELAMLTRMVVHAFSKVAPDNKTAAKAVDYLKRKGLQGNPLRSLGIQEQRT